MVDITKAPDLKPHEPAVQYRDSLGKYIAVYVVILAIAASQFAVAYSSADVTSMFGRMFFLALAEAGLALMFFMHLWAEKRTFLVSIAVFTLFVLGAMQYGWTDSFRTMMGHAPYSSTETQPTTQQQ